MSEAMGGRKAQIEGKTGVRLAVAIALGGPLTGALASLVLVAVQTIADPSAYYFNRPPLWQLVPGGAGVGEVVGVPLMLILWLPLHAWLYSNNRRHFWYYLSAGGLIGPFLCGGLYLLLHALDPLWILVAWGLGCSLALSTFFWLIRRPDRDVVATSAQTAAVFS